VRAGEAPFGLAVTDEIDLLRHWGPLYYRK
jgi:hypothetical protein